MNAQIKTNTVDQKAQTKTSYHACVVPLPTRHDLAAKHSDTTYPTAHYPSGTNHTANPAVTDTHQPKQSEGERSTLTEHTVYVAAPRDRRGRIAWINSNERTHGAVHAEKTTPRRNGA